MVVDTDNYDVLFGLDFLIKIGAIVDVEQGLIQVKHGPRANVEVLPLTMVNLLQRMNLEVLMQEATTILKDTHINDDFDWIPDEDSTVMTKEDDASTSDLDTSTNGSEHYDWESCQLKQTDCEDEFWDTKLEDQVRSKRLQEILQLILQEQVDGFMEEKITNADDYADWLRWVSYVEQSRHAMYESTHDAAIPLLLYNPTKATTPQFQHCCRFFRQKMATLIAATLSSWHHPTMMK